MSKRVLRNAPKAALLMAGGVAGIVGAFAIAHAAPTDPTPPPPAPTTTTTTPNTLHVTGTILEAGSGKGWHRSAVTIHWTCTDDDPNATVTSCPADQTDAQDGVSDASSADATDDMGHHATGTVHVQIDTEAPETNPTFSAPVYTDAATGKSWFGKGGPHVTATLTDDIVVGVQSSGVTGTRLDVDSGSKSKAFNPAGDDIADLHVASGEHLIRPYAEDEAGNIEISGNPRRRLLANIDGDDPVVAGTRSAQPNAYGWYNAPVSITYSCSDATTGVATCPTGNTVSVEGLDDTVSASATDHVNNTAVYTDHVNLDMSGPSVGVSPNKGPNANGWYNSDVVMHTTCADTLSGVDTCDADQVYSTEGANSGQGHGRDKAGNSVAKPFALKIDKTAPTVTISGVSEGQTITIGSTVTPSCSATDALSGLAGACVGTLSKPLGGVGAYTFTATATDLAGNVTIKTVNFRVVYGFNVSKPGNNSQAGAGGTVQMVFTATNAQGKAIQTAVTPVWAAPLRGGALNQSSTASPFVDAGQAPGSFTFDPKKLTYTFNWATTKAMGGSWWQLRVRLDDGTEHTVIVGLK